MWRVALLLPFLFIGLVPAQDNIGRARVKKIDVANKVAILLVDGKEVSFDLTEQTRVFGMENKDFKDRYAGLKEGDDVMFLPRGKDGKQTLAAIKPAGSKDGTKMPFTKVDSSKLKPLNEMGKEKYQGFEGGFYPDGKNERPAGHEKAGLELAKQIKPLDRDGKPAADGKVVLLSLGMSNTSQSSQGFERAMRGWDGVHPKLRFVNGAQGGMTAAAIQDPDDKGRGSQFWNTVDDRLKAAGVTRSQVQAVWIKQADAGPSGGFPKYAQTLQGELAKIVRVVHDRFPNAKLAYLSGRTYGGFATMGLNPEPYAYESGFAVKWLIEQQLKGDPELNYDPAKGAAKSPWLAWGPYLWANGETKRADGFTYSRSDFVDDGTHQSPTGQEKVGKLLLDFFRSDGTTKSWFAK